jgi:dCTP diphosphatase
VTTIEEIQAALRQFADDRDWQRFHSPKNLVMALSAEVGELTELFQWLTEEESQQSTRHGETRRRVDDELADVTLYLLRLADVLEVDLLAAAKAKIERNGARYPVERHRGRAVKHDT